MVKYWMEESVGRGNLEEKDDDEQMT